MSFKRIIIKSEERSHKLLTEFLTSHFCITKIATVKLADHAHPTKQSATHGTTQNQIWSCSGFSVVQTPCLLNGNSLYYVACGIPASAECNLWMCWSMFQQMLWPLSILSHPALGMAFLNLYIGRHVCQGNLPQVQTTLEVYLWPAQPQSNCWEIEASILLLQMPSS